MLPIREECHFFIIQQHLGHCCRHDALYKANNMMLSSSGKAFRARNLRTVLLSAESFKPLESAPHFSFPLKASSNGSFSVVLRGSLKIEEKLKTHLAKLVFMTKEESGRQREPARVMGISLTSVCRIVVSTSTKSESLCISGWRSSAHTHTCAHAYWSLYTLTVSVPSLPSLTLNSFTLTLISSVVPFRLLSNTE